MVEWIKNWVTTICVAIIFITAVELILPSNKYKKYVQFVLGLILISVIINPVIKLLNSNKDMSAYISDASKYIDSTNYENSVKKYSQIDKEDTINNFKSNIEESCTKLLKDEFPGNDYKVTASINYDENTKALNITKIDVGVKNNSVEKVQKVQIGNDSSSENNNEEIDTQTSEEIKNYLNNELKILKDNIKVYKAS